MKYIFNIKIHLHIESFSKDIDLLSITSCLSAEPPTSFTSYHANPNPLVFAVRMSSASSPARGCCPRELMLEEEGQLAQLHPRSVGRSLNGKAQNLTGVIWTVRFLGVPRRRRRPLQTLNFQIHSSAEKTFLRIM